MPWCPECKTEYREGFSRCYDCGAALVDRPPEEVSCPSGGKSNPPGFAPEQRPAFLTAAADNTEADMIRALLEAYGIPVFKSDKTAGGYMNIYMGFSLSGVDLFVPEKAREEALALMKGMKQSAAAETAGTASPDAKAPAGTAPANAVPTNAARTDTAASTPGDILDGDEEEALFRLSEEKRRSIARILLLILGLPTLLAIAAGLFRSLTYLPF